MRETILTIPENDLKLYSTQNNAVCYVFVCRDYFSVPADCRIPSDCAEPVGEGNRREISDSGRSEGVTVTLSDQNDFTSNRETSMGKGAEAEVPTSNCAVAGQLPSGEQQVDPAAGQLPSGEQQVDPMDHRQSSSGSSKDGAGSVRGVCPPHGVKAIIGRRPKMEDTFKTVPFLLEVPVVDGENRTVPPRMALQLSALGPGAAASSAPPPPEPDDQAAPSYVENFHFFGVFDGHGGDAAAIYCSSKLHKHLADAVTASPLGPSSHSEDGCLPADVPESCSEDSVR